MKKRVNDSDSESLLLTGLWIGASAAEVAKPLNRGRKGVETVYDDPT